MSEKTREVPQLANTTYSHTLVIESTHHANFIIRYTLYLEIFLPLWFSQTLPLKITRPLQVCVGYLPPTLIFRIRVLAPN